MQNILDTLAADQCQQSSSATPAKADQADGMRTAGAGAGPQGASDEFRTKAAPIPSQPGITETPESGATSAPAPAATMGNGRRRPAQPPVGNGDHHQRDGDHLAASWDFDRGEFVQQATGPPRTICPLHP